MLNKSPIFVIGFARGGTNIITNVISSHPDVRMLGGETHMVFHGKGKQSVMKWIHRISYLPIYLVARSHVFQPRWFGERKRLPRWLLRYIDLLLYVSKLMASDNLDKPEDVSFSRASPIDSRMLCKNPNGLAFTTDLFLDMYPDATFIAFVRNGLALCEGYVRRGRDPESIGKMYDTVCKKMIRDAQRLENFHIISFEDLISEPESTIRKIYDLAGLDSKKVSRVRLQAKASMDDRGKRSFTFGASDREVRWFAWNDIRDQFRQDVNENQIARLSHDEKRLFLKHAEHSMEHFGYLKGASVNA